jgi:hypothetical protein
VTTENGLRQHANPHHTQDRHSISIKQHSVAANKIVEPIPALSPPTLPGMPLVAWQVNANHKLSQ